MASHAGIVPAKKKIISKIIVQKKNYKTYSYTGDYVYKLDYRLISKRLPLP